MTRHTLTRLAGLLLVSALILTAGCTPPPKKRQFNNILARLNADLAAAAKEFYTSVAPYSSGVEPQQGAPRAAFGKCKESLRKVQEVFDDTKYPRGTLKGIALRLAYKEYLKAQHSILNDCFAEIVSIAENGKLGPGEKYGKIFPLLQQAAKTEKEAYDKLMEAQKEYADAHNYQTK